MPVRSLCTISKGAEHSSRLFLLKMKDDDEKSSLRHWEPIPNFFIIPLSILEQSKRKPAAGVVCAFGIRILQYSNSQLHTVTYEKLGIYVGILQYSNFFLCVCIAHSGLFIRIAGVAVSAAISG